MNRSRSSASAPSASPSSVRRRSSSSGLSRSSSWAQVAATQATVTTPARSDTGAAFAAISCRHAAARRPRPRRAASAAGPSRGRRGRRRRDLRGLPGGLAHPASAATGAPVAEHDLVRPARSPGTWPGSVAVISACPPDSIPTSSWRRSGSSSLITSSSSISGAGGRPRGGPRARRTAAPATRAAAGPGTVAAQSSAAERELDLVAVRPPAGEAATDVALAARGELGEDSLLLGLRFAAGTRSRAAGEPEVPGGARERRGQLSGRLRRDSTSGTALAASSGSQASRLLSGGAAPDPREQVVALRERAAVGTRCSARAGRSAARSRRDASGAGSGGALDEREPVGHEEADRGTAAVVLGPRRGAVDEPAAALDATRPIEASIVSGSLASPASGSRSPPPWRASRRTRSSRARRWSAASGR